MRDNRRVPGALSPAALALGTNKLSAGIGTFAAIARYRRDLRFSLREFLPVLAAAAVGAWLGARAAVLVDPSRLRPLLLAALPVVSWLVWSRRDFGREDASGRLSAAERRRRGMLAAGPIGLYDGFFGPGAGTFYALGFTRACGYDLVGATTRAKTANLLSSGAALFTFAAAGRVSWSVGLPMAVLSVAGNWVGAHLGVRKGPSLIRPVVVLVCAGLFAKLVFDALR
jgi:uncharacterized membrane protein YfcA